jgi:hypothetical protein
MDVKNGTRKEGAQTRLELDELYRKRHLEAEFEGFCKTGAKHDSS